MQVYKNLPFNMYMFITLLFLITESVVYGQSVSLDERAKKTYAPAVPGVVIVKLKALGGSKNGQVVMERIMQQVGGSSWKPLFPSFSALKSQAGSESFSSLGQVYEMRYDTPVAPQAVANLLAQDERIEYAEPRYRYTLSHALNAPDGIPSALTRGKNPVSVAPNDPQFSEMSHLRHVNMPEAWDIAKASEGNVLIAIIDGGVDWEHVDLIDNVWRNAGEVENGLDDDGNGLVDDLHGWNFPDDSNDPKGLTRTPFNGQHGTMVAGVAVAVTDNNTGISGASWNAKYIPVNAGCRSADNAVCFGYEGMIYAAREGADIINVSWGGPDSFLGREVVRVVQEIGALVVVSAGNGGSLEDPGINIDTEPSYPAAYDGVLVVGSTGKESDVIAPFSNFGVSVDVFAPGVNLNSTLPEDGYTTEASGTSFSVPFVSGLAALVKTQHDEWNMEQVREQIRATTRRIDEANDITLNGLLGSGRIDAVSALTDTKVPSVRVQEVSFVDTDSDGGIQEGEAVDVTLNLVNFLAPASGVTYSVTTQDTLATLSQSGGALGGIGSEESVFAHFSFQLAHSVPNDHTLRFNLSIQGDGFSSNELIDFSVNRITHDTGVLQVSLTDEGNIGWSDFEDSSEGQGFNYFGINWLFEGGLVIGVGENTILSSVRNQEPLTQDNDYERVPGSKFGILPGSVTTENGLVILNDSNEGGPVGVRIHQESYADRGTDNTNFIILRYILSQTDINGPTLNDMYIGLFMDWDLTTGGDFARYDASRRLGMVQSHRESPVIVLGTKLLSSRAGVSYRSIQNSEIFDSRAGGDGFTDEEKWDFLSGGIQTESVDDDDVSTLIASGPYQLVPGESIEVAFALLAARSVENMHLFSDNAQRLWEQTIGGVDPNPVSVETQGEVIAFELESAYPNPATAGAHIRFSIPQGGHTQLEVFDVLGRKIRTLLDTQVLAGVHTIYWDGNNEVGSSVSNGTYMYRLTVSASESSYSASRPLIVIR